MKGVYLCKDEAGLPLLGRRLEDSPGVSAQLEGQTQPVALIRRRQLRLTACTENFWAIPLQLLHENLQLKIIRHLDKATKIWDRDDSK